MYSLKDPSANSTTIMLRYSCADGRLKYSTRIKATPTWLTDKGTQAELKRFDAVLQGVIADYKIKGDRLTRADLKNYLDREIGLKGTPNLYALMRAAIDRAESGKISTPQNKKYSKGSIKTFRFTLSLWESFDPGLKSITIQTYHDFIQFMQDRDYSINYIGSQIKNFKTLCKWVGVQLPKEFKKMTELTYDIYLDEKELLKMYKLKCSDREAKVRDWFILDCYTGLRVSDLLVLTGKNYSDGLITIANKKTSETVVIPAHPLVKKILKKYKGFPPTVSDQELNRVIKGIAERAGIIDNVLFTITKGGKRKDYYLKKWEMVSNHTARRSFITNLLKNGVQPVVVMKLTGIKSFTTLQRYEKLSAVEAAKIAAGHEFFK